MSSQKTRLQAQRLRTLGEIERDRAAAVRGDLASVLMHGSAAAAYERWAAELESIAAVIDGVDRTRERLAKQLADLGLNGDVLPDNSRA